MADIVWWVDLNGTAFKGKNVCANCKRVVEELWSAVSGVDTNVEQYGDDGDESTDAGDVEWEPAGQGPLTGVSFEDGTTVLVPPEGPHDVVINTHSPKIYGGPSRLGMPEPAVDIKLF